MYKFVPQLVEIKKKLIFSIFEELPQVLETQKDTLRKKWLFNYYYHIKKPHFFILI